MDSLDHFIISGRLLTSIAEIDEFKGRAGGFRLCSFDGINLRLTQGASKAETGALTGANRNTIKDHLKKLSDSGHIIQKGTGRGTWYEKK